MSVYRVSIKAQVELVYDLEGTRADVISEAEAMADAGDKPDDLVMLERISVKTEKLKGEK
jgi:hypothetical protein